MGITFREAPVAFRERLVFAPADVRAALCNDPSHRDGRRRPCEELAVLSTCNRTEVYAVFDETRDTAASAFEALTDWLEATRGIARRDAEARFYRHEGWNAVRHLCRVAAGLDSLVIGESEIARQVSEAMEAAKHEGCLGPVLSEAFRTAIRSGRRARAETGINRKPASVSSVAVGLADETAGSLSGKRVVLIGTGKMGRLACEALRSRGVEGLTVVSRTAERAGGLATAYGATPRTLSELKSAIADADVVLSSTGAQAVIIQESLIRAVMERRRDRPLTVIDIAVPRDVDASVAGVEGVSLFDIDDLQDRIADHVAARKGEIPLVEGVIDEEMATFAKWQNQQGVQPLISDLRNRAEEIRRRETARVLRRLGDVDETTRGQFEHLSRSLVNKLLHEPTRRLRADPHTYASAGFADLTRALFGLDRALTEEDDGEERELVRRRSTLEAKRNNG